MKDALLLTPGQNFEQRLDAGAFSLVEVVLALAVATFGILAIVALLPAGLQSSKDSLEETQAINVMSEVIADRQATPFSLETPIFKLPALTMTSTVTNSFGVTDDNHYSALLSQARYRVDCVITPPGSGRLDPYQTRLKVSWPANSVNPQGFVESVITFSQP